MKRVQNAIESATSSMVSPGLVKVEGIMYFITCIGVYGNGRCSEAPITYLSKYYSERHLLTEASGIFSLANGGGALVPLNGRYQFAVTSRKFGLHWYYLIPCKKNTDHRLRTLRTFLLTSSLPYDDPYQFARGRTGLLSNRQHDDGRVRCEFYIADDWLPTGASWKHWLDTGLRTYCNSDDWGRTRINLFISWFCVGYPAMPPAYVTEWGVNDDTFGTFGDVIRQSKDQ